MTIIDTVLRFATITSVIPLLPRSKVAAIKWRQFQAQRPELGQLLRWFATSEYNVGLLTGDMVVIDFDDPVSFDVWRSWATGQRGIAAAVAADGYKVLTARGIHVYVTVTERVHTSKIIGGDIKAHPGYVLGAGSMHPSGVQYAAIDEDAPIYHVASLDEVLPDFFMVAEAPVAPAVPTIPQLTRSVCDDPWAYVDAAAGNLTQRIHSNLHVADFVDLTHALKTGPNKYLITCPFHDDHNPSFWIDTRNDICGCFAGCTAKPLDVINLYARLYGLSNQEAIMALARLL